MNTYTLDFPILLRGIRVEVGELHLDHLSAEEKFQKVCGLITTEMLSSRLAEAMKHGSLQAEILKALDTTKQTIDELADGATDADLKALHTQACDSNDYSAMHNVCARMVQRQLLGEHIIGAEWSNGQIKELFSEHGEVF